MGLKDLGMFAAVLAAWFVLSRWVLPWFGVPTCMSGNCGSGASCCPADFPPAAQPPKPAEGAGAESAGSVAGTEPEPEPTDRTRPETVP